MNWLSRQHIPGALPIPASQFARRSLLIAAACLAACGAPASVSEASDETEYSIHYVVTPVPGKHRVEVAVELSQERHLLREMRFDSDQLSDVRGDGDIEIEDGRLRWQPPERGGRLSWQVEVANKRNGDGYDAWLDANWGLFRAEDIIPRAATRTLKGASANTLLSFELPRAWSTVTEYAAVDGAFPVRKEARRFAQPSGWIVMGDLGVRREHIAGIRVGIAGPENQQVHRVDMLALLNWTLPELNELLPVMPSRLTIVSAGEPMWRGALSGPQSIYVHAERPLISENGTSTLLHEVMHVALGVNAEPGFDWIVEGLAEFYSLEILRRSGTLAAKRHASAMEQLETWSKSARTLCGPSSSGATTALAVVTLASLDAEIKKASSGEAGLDDALGTLLKSGEAFGLTSLRSAAAELIGQKPDALHIDRLPGCRKLALAD